MRDIREIDMHLRDDRVLEWLRERAGKDGDASPYIRRIDIAERFQCHPNTASAILKRLSGAGFIVMQECSRSRGYAYCLSEEREAA